MAITLDEAIMHCYEVYNERGDMCKECREEHRQLAKWLEELKRLKTAGIEEKKDCEKCIHFGKHATEYPCSHCRNCYTDKFKFDDTRTPKERGGEK